MYYIFICCFICKYFGFWDVKGYNMLFRYFKGKENVLFRKGKKNIVYLGRKSKYGLFNIWYIVYSLV